MLSVLVLYYLFLCSDSEIKIGQDEGKIHFEQVKLREKKRSSHDPFAELLSPTSNPRLRWSQELNPLYDYIKGFKVSDGVRLYDNQPSKLMESSKASDLQQGIERPNNKPGVIMEEDSEYLSSREETISPSDTTVYSPTPSDISRPTSSFSEPMSPNYSKKPHLYEEIMILPEKHEHSPPKAKGADLIQQMKRSVTEPVKQRNPGK